MVDRAAHVKKPHHPFRNPRRHAHPDGSPTDDLLKTYEKLAAGGMGPIITGYTNVMQNGKTFRNMWMFDSDATIDIYRSINDRPVFSYDNLRNEFDKYKIGDVVNLGVMRSDRKITVTVKLEEVEEKGAVT